MEIPKTLKVGKTLYYVVHEPKRPRKNVIGGVSYGRRTINLYPMPKEKVPEIFWHEVMHAILHDMGDTANNNEKFVIAVSKRLAQVVKTARFE